MKRVILFAMVLTILFITVNTAVFSYTAPDLDRSGSISVTMRYGGNNVPGGSMEIYRVADISSENGNYVFVPCGDFTSFDEDMTDVESDALVFSVAAYIAQNKITGSSMPIDAQGRVNFFDLEPGLYMLIQTVAAKGYNCANPFLVSIPMYDGEYIYDVDASAKAELTKDNNNPHEDTTPESRDNTTTSNTGDKLPQTGQLNWPIPILLVLGTTLVLIGLILCFGQRRGKNEK